MAAWAVGQTGRFKAALMGAGISDWGMQVGVGELGTQEAGLGGSCGIQVEARDSPRPVTRWARARDRKLTRQRSHGAGEEATIAA